ncbi:N-acetyltransferase [Fodinicurvata sp. EGI_FJ10296]|uniref:GNAT family N-acetyltransferase n=1 Tax=Fodinicurvata sp. EGI_FJ10296 TaxID=3231908 RepID=UPI003452A53E
MVTLAPESPDDHHAINLLLDQAFGRDRSQKTSYRYRDGIDPIAGLSMTAHNGDRLVGSIRYWPIRIGADGHPGLLLGPLAVANHSQGTGVGAALVFSTLETATAAGHEIVLLVGDLPYYSRFGFVPAAPHGIYMPDENPDRLQLTALAPGALKGMAGPVRRWDARGETIAPAGGPIGQHPMSSALDA